MADRSYLGQNDASRERLRALVARLTDEDLARTLVGGAPGWTVAAMLCHLAFWDRLWVGRFEEWERAGRVTTPPSAALQIDANAINGAMLPWWLSVGLEQVRHEVAAAAEAVDTKAAAAPDAVVDQVLAARPRTIIRAMHRSEHLDDIERALAAR